MSPSTFLCESDVSIGPRVIGCRNDFDFTLLFEQSILSLAPSILFFLFSFLRVQQLLRQSIRVRDSPIHVGKLSIIAIYASLQLVLLVLWSTESPQLRTPASIAAAVVSFVDALVICLLSHVEHIRSPRPSDLLNS